MTGWVEWRPERERKRRRNKKEQTKTMVSVVGQVFAHWKYTAPKPGTEVQRK